MNTRNNRSNTKVEPQSPTDTVKPFEVWTPRQAAKVINRSVQTLERWRRLRVGPPYRVIMGRPYYVPAEFTAWFDAQKVVSHGAAA